MLLDEPLPEQVACLGGILEGDFSGYSHETVRLVICQLLNWHKERRLLDVDQVVKVPLHINLANSGCFSRGAVCAQRQVSLGLEMRHVRDIVGGEELGLLPIRGSIAEAVGEDLREAQSRWAVFVVVPLVELVKREAVVRLHCDVEVAGGRHCESVVVVWWFVLLLANPTFLFSSSSQVRYRDKLSIQYYFTEMKEFANHCLKS